MKIDVVRLLVIDHVFEHRAKPQRLINLGLRIWREVNSLGVTAAFDIEDAVIGPAVLVVADE